MNRHEPLTMPLPDLKLEDLCISCGATGELRSGKRECPRCKGRGVVPSASGRQVLEFVRRYLRPEDSPAG